MKKNRLSLAFLSLLIAASPLRAQDTLQNETVEQKDKRMEWFSQAKLGIFIHWGIYSVRGVSESWSFFNNYLPYDEYMEQEKGFTASKYDPKAWVDLIKESGAKYTVITTKFQSLFSYFLYKGSYEITFCRSAFHDADISYFGIP